MKRRVTTIRDIARHIDLSHVTVSMVLNNREGYSVAPATRQRIVEAAAELGYVPNLLGRALVSGKTDTVALWINRLYTAIYASYYATLHMTAQTAGYRLALSQGSLFDDPFSHPHLQIDWPADGVIAVDAPQRVEDWLAANRKNSMPIVSLGPYTTSLVDSVRVDLGPGSRKGIEHFVAAGRRRIEFLTARGSAASAEREARYAAYSAVIKESGLDIAMILSDTEDRAESFTAVAKRLKVRPLPDAIFAHTDIQAAGAIRAIIDAGLSIPGDIAVLGVDGTDECEYMTPRLATVAQPVAEAAALAWGLLSARIAAPDREFEHHVLPAQFILRESAG